jgi:hypothetical protein
VASAIGQEAFAVSIAGTTSEAMATKYFMGEIIIRMA